MGTILSILGLFVWVMLIPLGIGIIPASLLTDRRRTLPITFILGQLLSLSLFFVISVPCMLLVTYGAFKYCVRIFGASELALFVIAVIHSIFMVRKKRRLSTISLDLQSGVNKRSLHSIVEALLPGELHAEAEEYIDPRGDLYGRKQRYSREGKILWVVFAFIMLFQVYMAVTRASFDGDDAYYVVESLLSYETDTMNTILPYTGGTTSLDFRHCLAVITMWIAFIGRVTGLHTTILAHTVLPFFLIPFTYLIYSAISRILFARKPDRRPMFMVIMAFFVMFGHTSISTSETFLLTRTWQGKSMLANIAIPLVVFILLWIGEDHGTGVVKSRDYNPWGPYIALILVNISSGVFSSMGVMLTAALTGLGALILSISYKKLSILLRAFIACIPNVLYAALYLYLVRYY
ncbi:DUF6077 domain-containing protein [Butyrivibrio sp. MC2013]|uniref:DUF6077 domain-containing protein n=1 Tax=Butyrivibrio sp. MC2013 TaxID=1280686 RepID=UPI000419701F|nr:DUF6077 domain-containing protein [Butyrivibrio sp. MC2013]